MHLVHGQEVEAIINGRPRLAKYLRRISPDVIEVEWLGLPKLVSLRNVSPVPTTPPAPKFTRGYKELFGDE